MEIIYSSIVITDWITVETPRCKGNGEYLSVYSDSLISEEVFLNQYNADVAIEAAEHVLNTDWDNTKDTDRVKVRLFNTKTAVGTAQYQAILFPDGSKFVYARLCHNTIEQEFANIGIAFIGNQNVLSEYLDYAGFKLIIVNGDLEIINKDKDYEW